MGFLDWFKGGKEKEEWELVKEIDFPPNTASADVTLSTSTSIGIPFDPQASEGFTIMQENAEKYKWENISVEGGINAEKGI